MVRHARRTKNVAADVALVRLVDVDRVGEVFGRSSLLAQCYAAELSDYEVRGRSSEGRSLFVKTFRHVMLKLLWSCLRRSRRSVARPALAQRAWRPTGGRRRRQRSWPLLVGREGSGHKDQQAKRFDAYDYSRCRREPSGRERRLINPCVSNRTGLIPAGHIL